MRQAGPHFILWERCVPGHISFVPVSDLLRLFKLVTASFGQAL